MDSILHTGYSVSFYTSSYSIILKYIEKFKWYIVGKYKP